MSYNWISPPLVPIAIFKKYQRPRTKRVDGRLRTCLSPGRKVLQIAYPHSSVRMHDVVFKFQTFKDPIYDNIDIRAHPQLPKEQMGN